MPARVLESFTRLLCLWVILAGILGYFYPPALTWFKPYVNWLFAFTMFGIGAVLKPSDFVPVLKQPHWVLMGTLAQFTIMPLGGFLIAKLLNLPPELALGVIVVGATPGAMASNVLSYLAKADVAYSVALTSTSTFLAPILTPLCVYLLASTWFHIEFWPMFLSIIWMVVLPLAAGLLIRRILGPRIQKILPLFPALSTLTIALICGFIVALNAGYLRAVGLLIFAAVLLHNAFGLLGGYAAGTAYRFDKKRRRTLSLEVGMQNAGLGAVLSLKHFGAEAALPNALFATWCVITASILAEIWSRRPLPQPEMPTAPEIQESSP